MTLFMKVQRAVFTLTLASMSHLKVLRQFFYVMGKALSGKLSCTQTNLVWNCLDDVILRKCHKVCLNREIVKIVPILLSTPSCVEL